ncbi:uncharacterized protein N7484_009950 [Penicillium longicatenatum]|uniref:uncharacterized protein n=1 Tax=Penicillium longicatenatum TaxID=1561947 RepID=UPI002548ECAB|nr:uncharacterized protein N7484_009950 [Penicillium longicatenatum]KAJ5636637.1 hypothetical protein N7484_009950 [Penicillium longicatenatum]
MLERAASGLETAGRRFFRDPNGAIRTRRSLCHHFWKYNTSGRDAAHWFLALTQPPGQHLSSVPNPPYRSLSANETVSPFLDFLYPQKTQEFVALRASRLPRRPGLRRRKRTLANPRRTYASEASSLQQNPHYEPKSRERPLQQDMADASIEPITAKVVNPAASSLQQHPQEEPKAHRLPLPQDIKDVSIQDKRSFDDLMKFLKSPEKDSSPDRAWVLYLAAGRPLNARASLCAFFSLSEKAADAERAWNLFQDLPLEECTHDHFHQIIQSQLRCGKPENLVRICEMAVARENADFCFTLAFSYFVNRRDWANAEKIWTFHSQWKSFHGKRKEKQEILSPASLNPKLPEYVLALAVYAKDEASEVTAQGSLRRDIVQSFLTRISKSSELLTGTSMNILIPLIQVSDDLKIMTLQHHVNIMESLQSSTKQLDFARSIIFYQELRAFLDRDPKQRLSKKLWNRQLELLVKFELTESIQYFLGEVAHFHGKPSMQTYRDVLNLFGRSGNVSQVNIIFDKLVADYGKPKSRRLVTPLLYAHASVGDVPGTVNQFRRLAEEFHLKPNTVCWNILITAYANNDDSAGAFYHFSKMIRAKMRPDSHTFGIMMGVCANKGDVGGVRALLREAEKQRVTVTMAMLSTVAQAYISNGRLDLAEKLATTCLKLNVEGSPMRMWNALLMQYAFRIDHHSFFRVCSLMREAGLRPDEITYATDLLRLVLVSEPDQARMALRRNHKRGVLQATELHYAILILGYIKTRQFTMVKVIFREMLERFNHSGLESSLLNLEAEIPPDHWTKRPNRKDRKDEKTANAEKRIKTLEILLIESISRCDTTALASMLHSSKGRTESLAKAFGTWHYEYLIQEYGATGAISMARELYQRQLSSMAPTSAQGSGSFSAPLRLVNAMMSAHLNAEQYKEVGECWQLAFSSAIKTASRVKVLDIFKPSASIPGAISDSSAHDQSEIVPNDPSDKQNNQIIHSRRFILSRTLSLFLQSLAHQHKPEQMVEVVAEVEAAGFELSTFNRSTLVQMLAVSVKFDHILEAFRIFEDYFMPHWPGWNRLIRGQSLKPCGTPRTLSLIEDKRTPLQSGRYLGKEAAKYWKHVSPDYMQPTYNMIIHLAAAWERIRSATIVKGSHELDKLSNTAPRTLDAIIKMPYLRDRIQGVVLRQRGEQPDHDKAPLPSALGSAPGGVLGPGGRTKRATFVHQGKVDEVEIVEWVEQIDVNDDKQQEVTNKSAQTPDEHNQKTDVVKQYHERAALSQEGWDGILSPANLLDLQSQDRYTGKSMKATRPGVLRKRPSNSTRSQGKPLNLFNRPETDF